MTRRSDHGSLLVSRRTDTADLHLLLHLPFLRSELSNLESSAAQTALSFGGSPFHTCLSLDLLIHEYTVNSCSRHALHTIGKHDRSSLLASPHPCRRHLQRRHVNASNLVHMPLHLQACHVLIQLRSRSSFPRLYHRRRSPHLQEGSRRGAGPMDRYSFAR